MEDEDNSDISPQHMKKGAKVRSYQKEYHQSQKWKEYYQEYTSTHKTELNQKKKLDRSKKNSIFSIIKNCIEAGTVHFDNKEDLDEIMKWMI